jgi:hypothetical protein
MFSREAQGAASQVPVNEHSFHIWLTPVTVSHVDRVTKCDQNHKLRTTALSKLDKADSPKPSDWMTTENMFY